jgi:hypothetical protein
VRSCMASGVRAVVDRSGLEQHEPEVRHTLQEPLELGLVAHLARQRRVAPGARQCHAVQSHAMESRTDNVAELSLDGEPIETFRHVSENPTADRALARNGGFAAPRCSEWVTSGAARRLPGF